jgi:hypothetical protein
MDRDRQIWSAGASQMAREAAPHCLGTFSSVAVTAGLLGSVIKNVNVLLFAFNRVENGAHVHVHGVHHLFSIVRNKNFFHYFFPM